MISGHRNFVRAAIARTLDSVGAAELAEKRWGAQSGALALLQRSAVGALASGTYPSTGGLGDTEFFSSVIEQSIPGRLTALRHVAFGIRLLKMTTQAQGYWVGEGKAIGLSKQVLAGSTLPRRKIGVIIVQTLEAMQSMNPIVEASIESDIRAAFVGALDQSLLDPANAGVPGVSPAAITSGVTSTVSSLNPGTDLATLLTGFTGDLSVAVLVSDPLTFAKFAMHRDASGGAMWPDISPRGGSILGIPALSTRHSPPGQIALIDPSGIAFAADTLELSRSNAATLEMDDAPTGDSLAPTAATKATVNLFQSDSVGLKGVLYANWQVERTGGVAIVTGANYPTAAA